MIRRDERDAQREAEVRQWFQRNITSDITPEEAIRRVVVVLSETGWKIRIKDLTPTLRELADAYLRAVVDDPELAAEDTWLRDAHRWGDKGQARAAALNHLRKRHQAQ